MGKEIGRDNVGSNND